MNLIEEIQDKIDNCKLKRQSITDRIIEHEKANSFWDRPYLRNAINKQKHIISIIPKIEFKRYKSDLIQISDLMESEISPCSNSKTLIHEQLSFETEGHHYDNNVQITFDDINDERLSDLKKQFFDEVFIISLLNEIIILNDYCEKRIILSDLLNRQKSFMRLISLLSNVGENVDIDMDEYLLRNKRMTLQLTHIDDEIKKNVNTIKERYNSYVINETVDFRYCLYSDGIGIINYIGGTAHEVTIPETIDGNIVYKIESNAFEETFLTRICLPKTISEIGFCSFYNTNRSLDVVCDISVKSLDDNSFCGCSISNLELNMESIPDYVLMNCVVQNLTIGNNVKNISDNAFFMASINRVIIPEGVESINLDLFDLGYGVDLPKHSYVKEILFLDKNTVPETQKIFFFEPECVISCFRDSEAYRILGNNYKFNFLL